MTMVKSPRLIFKHKANIFLLSKVKTTLKWTPPQISLTREVSFYHRLLGKYAPL